jgi:hypothetical protein
MCEDRDTRTTILHIVLHEFNILLLSLGEEKCSEQNAENTLEFKKPIHLVESLHTVHVRTTEQNELTIQTVLVPFLYYLCKVKMCKKSNISIRIIKRDFMFSRHIKKIFSPRL